MTESCLVMVAGAWICTYGIAGVMGDDYDPRPRAMWTGIVVFAAGAIALWGSL